MHFPKVEIYLPLLKRALRRFEKTYGRETRQWAIQVPIVRECEQ